MWYDFPADYSELGQPEFRDRPDLASSRQQLTDFLNTLLNNTEVPPSRIFLGGFSQGGAMTLDVGLEFPFAGLMVLSGYLHAPIAVRPLNPPPVLLVHGRQDTVVPLHSAQRSRDSLNALGVKVRYEEFDTGHDIPPIVLTQIQSFVKDNLTDISIL
jgi:phospholipase/carboxylesterase